MPALTTRKAARERLLKMAQAAIDRLVPADEAQALRGSVFADFENQSYAVGNDVLTAMMEERAKLESNARVERAGRCPYCASQRTYLEAQSTRIERLSPSGPVLLEEQHARCRACNGSFSPASQSLGVAQRGIADPQGGGARGARSGDTTTRQSRRGAEPRLGLAPGRQAD
jgi:hypothetical protein